MKQPSTHQVHTLREALATISADTLPGKLPTTRIFFAGMPGDNDIRIKSPGQPDDIFRFVRKC